MKSTSTGHISNKRSIELSLCVSFYYHLDFIKHFTIRRVRFGFQAGTWNGPHVAILLSKIYY